jgi:golgin subfamily B member 1
VAENHDAEWIRSEVERLAQETGGWPELVDAYTSAYTKFADPVDALPLMTVVARVQEQELGEIDKAVETNNAILEVDESNATALAALERLYLGRQEYEPLLDIYRRKLDLTLEGEARTQIQYKIGQLYEEDVRDDLQAIEAYQAVIDANGDEPEALRALDRIYTRNERWDELADVLGREIILIGPEESLAEHVEFKFRLGQIKEKYLGDVVFAEEQYREILDLDRSHDGARHALERKLDEAEGEAQLNAAAILESIYEEVEQWPRLIQVHEIQLVAETNSVARVGLLMRIGQLHSKRLGDADAAFDAYARAFREDPAHEEAKLALEDLCGLLDDGWPKLIELFTAALANSDDLPPGLVHELAIKVASAYIERLDETERAVEYYRRALQVEPEDTAAIDALERIFSAHERYVDLLEIYRRKVDICDEQDERLNILFRIAAIYEEMLQNREEAISTYNEILSHDGDNLRALRALDRLYVDTEQWQELADNLSRQLIICESDIERVELLVRLAQLRESQLEEVAAAVETYRQVIELQADNAGAIAALERLISHEDHELAIAQILEPIYRATAAWERQIGVYEIMAKHAFDPERKIELLHAIAELYELGGDDGMSAFGTYSRALREEPRHENTQAQIDRLARMLGNWGDVVSLYDQIVGAVGDEELKVSLLTKLAQVYELELGEDTKAVATYNRVLDVSPGHVEAAAAIQAIHERNADYPALVVALKTKSELIHELPERKALLFKAAQILEEVLEQYDEAIATYCQVLDLDDVDLRALDALERLYIRLERWEPLKDVYAKKAELAETPDDKKQMLYVLGQVYDRELGDTAKAIETYQAILDIEVDELPAIQALDRLFGQAERWYDLLQNLERQVELAESAGECVGLKYRIGQLWQRQLTDLARAIEAYKDALDMDPSHYETLQALEALLRSNEGEPVLAAHVLEPIYEAQGEFERLVDVLEVMVGHCEDPLARVELLHRLANLHEYRLERYADAFTAFSRALREDNGNETSLAHLERLADAIRSWQPLAELYASEAEKSLDALRQVDLLSRLARIHVEELGHIEEAIATYKRILEVEYDNRHAVLALDRLYTATERWQELAEILRKEIQLVENDEDIIPLQFRLGQVLEQNLRNLPGAIEVYREVLGLDPSNVNTLSALEMIFLEGQHEVEIAGILEPLYQSAGEWEKLHKIFEVQLSKMSDPSDRLVMHQRLAELAEGNLGDPERAFRWWGQALTEDPHSELAVEEVERLAAETAVWHDLVNVYIRVLELHSEPEVQRATLLRLGTVYQARLGDPTSAVETYLRVLAIDPKDVDALAALDPLYESAGMYEELVEILRRRIEVTLDGELIIELHFRRGYFYSEALGDLDASLACYEEILEQETRNRRALEAEEAIFFRCEDWRRLYGVYEKLVDVADGDAELSDIYAHMARLLADALEDQEAAIDMWGRVLDIRGEDAIALAALTELYARRQMWQETVDVIERHVNVTDDPLEKIVLYKRLGGVWESRLGRERNALEAWLQAYALDPNDLETLQTLAHLYRATQSWEELSQTLRQILELAQVTSEVSEAEVVEYWAQLGELEGDVLGRVNEAVAAWRRVLGLNSGDFRALGALEQLFSREGRWEECIDILERRAAVQTEPQAAIDTLLQAGAIWEEKVENLDQAASLYERVRAADPANAIASAQLEVIYRKQYNWERLNEVLLERVEYTEERSARIDILQAVAKIYEQEMGDQESAFVVLQAGFREDYGHESVASELERLATAAGKWEELLADYSEMVQNLERENPESACDLWVKIGRWYGDHLSHVDYAIHSVQQALRLNPQHLSALSALADFQRKRGSWSELIEVLSRHAAIEPDTEKKVDLYLNLADLLEGQIRDPMQAMNAYQSALQADPSCSDALAALDRLYRAHEMWEPLIDILGRRAELAEEPGNATRMKLEIGRLWDEMIVDSGQAISAYQDVTETDPHNLHALRALERLYEKTGQSEKYLDVLEAQLDASPTDAEQVALYERMASAWEERFGKLDRAAECLEKIVAIDVRNFSAYQELERLYRQESKFESLVDTYRRHINAATDPNTRIELYTAMGQVYEDELKEYDRAIEAYTDVLTFDPDEPRALDALGRLYERIEEWERAIQMMQHLVQNTSDPAQKVDLHHRIGRITYSYIGEQTQAEEQFLRALSIDSTYVPAMEDLVRLYSDRGDWLKAAQMMVRAEAQTANVLDKVRLLYDAGVIYLHKLQQRGMAKDMFAGAIALDPEHVPSGEPLADLYFASKEWQALSPVLDMLVRKLEQLNKDASEINELYYRTAKCAEELGDFEKATQFYKGAYDIDPTYLPTLVGRADLLFKMQDWEGAGKIYQTILVQHRDSQGEADVVRIYNRLGNVRLQLGERKKALNMFEKALEINPHHVETLNAVIDIQADQGDYEQVIHAKRALVRTANEDEAVKILSEIGAIYREKLQNAQKSIAAYREALEIKPDNHQLLQKVLDLYTETRQWKMAVEVIVRFADLEADALRKGKYFQAAATICRDELKALDEAIEYYDRALDCFFNENVKIPERALQGCLKAFADIDKILTAKRDWKAQERAYRRMIKRLQPGDTVLISLWHALGEIYRSRLQQYKSAIAAFEVAQQLQPENAQRGEILAELYILAGPDMADKAVAQHYSMLMQDAYKYDSYQALRKIYMDSHQYDKTWCVCSTLAFLNKADPDEMQFYEQYKPRGFVKAKQRITEDMWRKVYHPDEDLYIGAIFGAIQQAAALVRAKTHKEFGLKRKDRRPIETDQLQFSKIFYYVAQVVNAPLPEVYLQPDQQGELLLANTHEKQHLIPSFVVRAGLLQGRPEREIAYVAARQLTFMRSEHFLKLALPTNTELKTALLSAVYLVQPKFPVPNEARNLVAQYIPMLQAKVTPQILEQLGHVVHRFLQHAGRIDLAKWGNAVELTTNRVGFVICGDIQVAAKMISVEPTVVGGPQVKDKIKELVLYSVSEDFFEVRQHLGTTIG